MESEFARSRPGAVLFACNFNRVRSPMAEALLKRFAYDRIFVDSCGVRRDARADGEGVDPFVEAVMAELACDLGDYVPKTFDDVEDGSFDLVVSFTPEAQHRAAEFARGRAVEIEYWPIHDPTQVEGSRETRLAAYREVRDALAARIAQRFAVRRPVG
jgi:protein-tyrosine-phosphatase